MYDASIARWNGVDALAENRNWLTQYNFVQNSPLFRIDPDGLTDYTINSRTGEVARVGDENDDEHDRVVKTNRRGEVRKKGEGLFGFLVKKSERGKAKTEFGGIAKGILKDGQNLRTKNTLIEVGQEGQPSNKDVETFALKLSNYVGREIGGAYFSKDGGENTTHITLGKYDRNTDVSTKNFGHNTYTTGQGKVLSLSELTGFFHTHPTGVYKESDRLRPSDDDLDSRDDALKINSKLIFRIITAPARPNGNFFEPIDYTRGFQRQTNN